MNLRTLIREHVQIVGDDLILSLLTSYGHQSSQDPEDHEQALKSSIACKSTL